MAHLSHSYRHSPLDPASKQIRLLKLNGRSQPSLGSLHTFTLGGSDLPPFKALSYVWGLPNPLFNLSLSDGVLGVSANLYDFFQELSRDAGVHEAPERRWLWVDQICIDQNNMAEKSHQVSLMAEIYAQAKEVVVWMDTRCQSAVTVNHILSRIGCARTVCTYEELEIRTTRQQRRELTCAFFSNTFFTRIWCFQEWILARKLEIWHGSNRLSDTVVHSLNLLDCDQQETHSSLHNLRLRQFSLAARSHGAGRYAHVVDLGNLLYLTTGSCRDPRDKIYGLLGVISTAYTSQIHVDYGQPLEQVFAEAWLAIAKVAIGLHDVEEPIYSLLAQLIQIFYSLGNEMVPSCMPYRFETPGQLDAWAQRFVMFRHKQIMAALDGDHIVEWLMVDRTREQQAFERSEDGKTAIKTWREKVMPQRDEQQR